MNKLYTTSSSILNAVNRPCIKPMGFDAVNVFYRGTIYRNSYMIKGRVYVVINNKLTPCITKYISTLEVL